MVLTPSFGYLFTLLPLLPYFPTVSALPDGVLATGTMGVTNPPQATLGTAINQTSMARLVSANSIDDFCLFAPPAPGNIGDTESFEVAWCTQPRNNARVIPDGTITGVSFLKTDFYIQLMGTGDLTKLNILPGDQGGELDPHGATGEGNPVGGNVTTNIGSQTDISYTEWMMYVSATQFCFRICINANATYPAGDMCWHELDEMGCEFVMPGIYNGPGIFETCEAEVAYPPGWYPIATVSGSTQFSKFSQRYTGTYSNVPYTIGDTVTPSAPYSTPRSYSCSTTSTISNGIPLASLGVSGGSLRASGISTSRTGSLSPSPTSGSDSSHLGGSTSGNQTSGTRKYNGGLEIVLVSSWAVLAGIGAVALLA